MSIEPFGRPLFAAALCASAVLAWTTPAHAQNPDQEAFFSLSVNRVEQGEIFAVLRGDDVLVARSDLEAAGLANFTATDVQVGARKLVSLASMRPRVRFVVDEEAIALRVDAPIAMLPAHHLDLGAPPPDISYRRRASVFLNYAPSVAFGSPGPATGSAFVETGAAEQNRLWYTGVYATTTGGVARGLTTLTVDDREKMVRLSLGDTNVSAGAIGGAAVIGGLTLARDFNLNPYFIRFPSMRFTSATDVPARVDVYVNGIRVRSQTIDPGTFTLDNVRGLVGAGTVRYVVRDVLGREQLYSSPYYVGPTVFAKGIDDFALSVGFPRDRLGVESFAYEGPALIGYYQRGVTDAVTLGARAEARWDRVSGGPSIATATPVGLFSLEAAASLASGERAGAAAIFSYQYLSRLFNAGASVRTLSDDYATATLTPEMDRSLLQTSMFASVPVSRRASVASELSVDVHRDLPPFERVGMFSQVQLAHDLTLYIDLSLASLGPRTSSLDGFLSLAWTPDSPFTAKVGAEKTGNLPGANLQVTKASTFGEDWSMVGTVDVSNVTQASVYHRIQTKTNTVSTYLDWHPQSSLLSVEPAGSVVWVSGGGFFLSRPVFDSFALVHVPHVKGVRVYLNAQEVGRTNADGNALVPSLISYYGSEIKIASEDVPLDYTLDRDSLVVAPPRRGAGFAEFPTMRVHYYRGRVRVVRNGVEEVPVYGDLAIDPRTKEVVSPIGVDGTFELEGLTAGKHEAEIRHTTGICRFTLEAKEATVPLVDLGVLRCLAK